MSDWRTLKQMVLDDLNKPNDGSFIELEMVSVLRFIQPLSFWFNQEDTSFTTTTDVYEYQLPGDFTRMLGTMYFTVSGSPTSRRALTDKTVDWVNEYRYALLNGGWDSIVRTGYTTSYAIFNGKFILAPVPTEDGHILDFRYVKDLGTPSASYSGSAYTILAPGSPDTAIAATYTNAWFKEALDFLKFRVEYQALTNRYRDPERAQVALMSWTEQLNRLQRETVNKLGQNKQKVRPWL